MHAITADIEGQISSLGPQFACQFLTTRRDVAEKCARTVGSTPSVANVLAIDEAKDLALLKTDAVVTTLPPFRTDARLGESIYAFGFPLAGLLASSGNFTSGNITANAGIEDDVTQMQISAPVQPGNSGGPLLDQFGNIVGVVVAKLNALKYAEVTKDVPQNVNFAIKSSIAVDFLKAHGLVTAVADAEPLSPVMSTVA